MTKKNLVVSIEKEIISQSAAIEIASLMQKFYSVPDNKAAFKEWCAKRKAGTQRGA